ncbi:Arginyl-tRNA--protein transferase 1 [Gnomoniopsis sp. IMI 355080]|nr:Arginyl-tRNA--protein transferase 1 [Gnomoniopsis sp. IMI 355080]
MAGGSQREPARPKLEDQADQEAGTSIHTPDDTLSYIVPIGYSNSEDCGYCRNSRSGQSSKRYSYYASGYSLTPEFYQVLIDRCWRRSGSLLYRPNQKAACCPHYTLRLDSTECTPSKDQRQAVNRFNRFVLGENYVKESARKHPLTREQARKRDSTFDLVERIHEAESETLHADLQPAHELKVTLESDDFTQEKYAVYKNYQSVVHGENPASISERGFRRFLCESSVRPRTEIDSSGREVKLGSFHQCYRLDGKLVAIGVLDLLPHAVSAVYFMYDESIQKLQPGKLGALREIALAKEGGYRYWYPGYYIHSCPKMKYKVDYSPQYVLDPETLGWDLLDKDALAIFDKQAYVSLSKERVRREGSNATGGNNTPKSSTSQLSSGLDGDAIDADEPGGTEGAPIENGEEDEDDQEISLFTSNMPGIASISDLEASDLDHIRILVDHTEGFFMTGETVMWSESIRSLGSLKSKIAELIACVGPDLASQIALDFRRSSRQRA